jgi:hypothetical protein
MEKYIRNFTLKKEKKEEEERRKRIASLTWRKLAYSCCGQTPILVYIPSI